MDRVAEPGASGAMNDSAKPTAVVLLWSYAHEPMYLAQLERQYAGYVLCPLRPVAWESAAQHVAPERLCDVFALVTPRERLDIETAALRQIDAFGKALLAGGRQPWLAVPGCSMHEDLECIFYFLRFWPLMLERLAQRFPRRHARLHGLFSNWADPGRPVLAAHCLELFFPAWARAGAAARAAPARGGAVAETLVAGLGDLVNRLAGRLCAGERAPPETGGAAPVVVCGLQGSDSFFQRVLVERLQQAGVQGLRWLVPEIVTTRLSEDERAAEPAAVRAVRRVVRERTGLRWRHPLFGRLSARAIRRRVRRAFAAVTGGALTDGQCGRLADWLMAGEWDVRLRYEAVARALDACRPRLLVANSSLGGVTLAHEWARRRGCRYLRLPHGVEYGSEMAFRWAADDLGVMGAHHRRHLLAAGLTTGERCFLAGGVHVAAQNLVALKEAGAPPPPERRILLLLTFVAVFQFPDSHAEMKQDLLHLGRACAGEGHLFSVRNHPRDPSLSSYPMLVAQAAQAGIPLEISDARQSLIRDLQRSAMAVIRLWSGAAIAALYAGKPLIGWLPRPSYAASDDILRELPLCATTAEELGRMVHRWSREADFREDVLRRQRELLADHLADPWGDPFDPSVRRILRVVQEGGTPAPGRPSA